MRARVLVLLVTAVLAFAAAGVLLVLPASAGNAPVKDVGWWYRAKTGPLGAAPVPAPTVPDGGLYVAGSPDPDGATAISAVRFTLQQGDALPVLTLKVASQQGKEVTSIAACPSGSAWTPVQAGTWDSKPKAACDLGSVQGIPNDDGSAYTFALDPIVKGTDVDVVIVPGAIPGAPAPATGVFSLAFQPPGPDAVATSSGGDGGSGDPDAAIATPPVDAFSTGAASSGDFGSTDVGTSPGAEPFSPALPESDQGVDATAPSVRQANPPLAAAGKQPSSKPKRGIGIVMLVLGLVAAAWAAREQLFGGGVAAATPSEPQPGGLGRFAVPRTGTPPPL